MSTRYATEEELAEYLGKELNEITDREVSLLDKASRFIETKTRNPDGIADDKQSVAKQAVIEQVEWWLQTGDELEQMQYMNDFDFGDFSADEANLPSMCPKAKRTLILNGMLNKSIDKIVDTY